MHTLTTSARQHLPRSLHHALHLLLAACALAPAQAQADWRGAFQSNALKTTINVAVRLPSAGADGELRFAEKSCSLAIQAGTSATSYTLQRMDKESDPGPYCAIWLGGTLATTSAGAGAVQASISSTGKTPSHIRVMLRERP
jgi:hypothetical protein